MPKPKTHFFVCRNQRTPGHPKGCCHDRMAADVYSALGKRLQETEAYGTVMLSAVGNCLGPCELGPIMVVYPDNVWYGRLNADKAVDIFNSHVNEGKPVKELLLPEGAY
ncbi:MAG: hypothetical protein IEMM0002_1573 [bacterium]|nr:MAG: hypothetical protein IEMM0002_1573 [bacterium]